MADKQKGRISSKPEDLEGAVIGTRYRLDEFIGGGGFGQVYRAYDYTGRRIVAVKRLRDDIWSDTEAPKRALNEARALAEVRHTNVVEIYDVGHDGDLLYVVLEFIDGETLAVALNRRRKLPLSEATFTILGVADALAMAHSKGIVHRDVKPANILLTKFKMPKLTDFGIARFVEEKGLTAANVVLGDPRYMAPEQRSGEKVGPEADVYSLGLVFVETLTGARATDAAGLKVLRRTLKGHDPDDLLYSLIEQMLDQKRSARPANGGIVAQRIRDWQKACAVQETLRAEVFETIEVASPRLTIKAALTPAETGIVAVYEGRHAFEEAYPFVSTMAKIGPGDTFRVVAKTLYHLMNKKDAIKDAVARGAHVELCLMSPEWDRSNVTYASEDFVLEHDIRSAVARFDEHLAAWASRTKPLGSIALRWHDRQIYHSFTWWVSAAKVFDSFWVWDLSFGPDLEDKCMVVLGDGFLTRRLSKIYGGIYMRAQPHYEYRNGKAHKRGRPSQRPSVRR